MSRLRQRDPITGKLYRIISPAKHFHSPPKALRQPGIRFDNLTLVPASMLPLRAKYQELANALPRGQVLIVLPTTDSPGRRSLCKVAQTLEARGHRVTTLPSPAIR